MTDAPVIDIARIPFSRYGSYLSICHDSANHQLAVHHVWRRFEDYAFTLSFSARGATPAWTASATPWALRIASDAGEARLYIKDDSSCVLESRGLDVRLSRADPGVYGVEESAGRFKIISQPQCTYAHVRVFHGKGKLDGPHLPLNKQSAMRRNHRSDLSVVCEDDRIVMQLDIANRERRARETPPLIERDLETVRREWEAFCSGMPEIPLERRPHALLAWYNLWSYFVRAT
ncbi:MAG: hypothetical protein HYV35_03745, partial [Lentisphaerae bacterium]|nr:hypothetical protein [Lentisphaerota bacterium]